MRRRVNDWTRSSYTVDAVLDADALLRDPAQPSHLLPIYDGADHLHPGDAGNRAMADAIYLDTIFGDTP